MRRPGRGSIPYNEPRDGGPSERSQRELPGGAAVRLTGLTDGPRQSHLHLAQWYLAVPHTPANAPSAGTLSSAPLHRSLLPGGSNPEMPWWSSDRRGLHT